MLLGNIQNAAILGNINPNLQIQAQTYKYEHRLSNIRLDFEI